MEEAIRATPTNVFPQFDSKGAIGSVHTSSVKLRVTEADYEGELPADFDMFKFPVTRRRISSSRRNMKICGGQGYLPLFKSNTYVEQRKNLEQLGHLPLLVQRVLSSPQGSFDQEKSKLIKEMISKFATLHALLDDQNYELKNTGKNIVRFEFFVTSTLRNVTCDITLPVPSPWELMTVIDHTDFQDFWSEHFTIYSKPLKTFVDDVQSAENNNLRTLVSSISPEIRTCLVFCSEKCVQAANIIGFRGRIMNAIWKELSGPRYDEDFFILPATAVKEVVDPQFHDYCLRRPRLVQPDEIEENVEAAEGNGKSINIGLDFGYSSNWSKFTLPFLSFLLEGSTTPEFIISADPARSDAEYYAINPLALKIERQYSLRITERQLRSPPEFLQTSQGQLKKVLNLPFAYFRFRSKIHACTLKYSNPDTETPDYYGAFEEPNYVVLGAMTPLDIALFQERLGQIIWESYDTEFWFILKERAYQRTRNTGWVGFENVDLDLANFPATVEEYGRWIAPQGMDPLTGFPSTEFMNRRPEIKTVGKSTWNCEPRDLYCHFLTFVLCI